MTQLVGSGVVQGIFEIQLVTGQHDAMVHFYREVVGLEKLFSDERRGRVHLGLGTGQLILAREHGEDVFAEWPGVPPRIYTEVDETVSGPLRHGPVHYAFHVDELQWSCITERLTGLGSIELRGPLSWGAGFQSLYFRDPDGNCVELICEVLSDEQLSPRGFRH